MDEDKNKNLKKNYANYNILNQMEFVLNLGYISKFVELFNSKMDISYNI